MNAHLQYGRYVVRHKWFVFIAGRRTRAPLWRLVIHDWSKMTRAEWSPYVRSFYGPLPRTDAVKAAFARAWLHHIHVNKHHWQHWVLHEDSGATKVIEMPDRFVREMVADWMGAGRAITGKWDVGSWYAKNRDVIVLHETTRARVDGLIEMVST